MNPNFTLFFLLLFISSNVVSQEKAIHGRILIADASPLGVIILNLSTEKETVSDTNGKFSIAANEGDVLVFHASNLDGQRKIIDKQDYDSAYFEIRMTSKIEQLDEVEISKSKITALSVGVLSSPVKQYTPSERRLKTAGEFKPIHLLGLLGGSLPLDPIINAINGRTKRLRKEITVEHREMLITKINERYSDAFFTDELGIPFANIGGFKYYLIEFEEFERAFLLKQETQTFFIMSRLSAEYLKILENGE